MYYVLVVVGFFVGLGPAGPCGGFVGFFVALWACFLVSLWVSEFRDFFSFVGFFCELCGFVIFLLVLWVSD